MFSIKQRIRQLVIDYHDPPVASESLSVRPGRVTRVEKRDLSRVLERSEQPPPRQQRQPVTTHHS